MKEKTGKHLLYALTLGIAVLTVNYFWDTSPAGQTAMIITTIVFVFYELKQEIRSLTNQEEGP